MVDQHNYIIAFEGVSVAEANLYAGELRGLLLDARSDVEVNRKRDDPSTQDFGATLVLILGTPALAAIAKAIGDWLTLRRQARIVMTGELCNGKLLRTVRRETHGTGQQCTSPGVYPTALPP